MERRAFDIRGLVQGVGFRPFVYGIAAEHHLNGFVLNLSGGVVIEAEGDATALDEFCRDLSRRAPLLARIDSISWECRPPRGDVDFRIAASVAGGAAGVFISPDTATCHDCLRELFDRNDRRYRFPFINCTNCGPRLTIVRGAPYDRSLTTMAGFAMCNLCLAEYEDPADRRFHAQPTCCPQCGPRLQLLNGNGTRMTGDPLSTFVAAIQAGRVGALKGLGGYHLVCDARSAGAVSELRRRKHRDEKPFAIMVKDLAAIGALCDVNPEERELLHSMRRPIVLLKRKSEAVVAEAVAPGNPHLGVMLPYTPLHHLLFEEYGDGPLVMTSGNRSDEPIAYEDEDAVRRLRGTTDLFLKHDRPIHVRCDDSVARIVTGRELPLRRSRGYAPEPIRLPLPCPRPILAVGGQLKGAFALGRGRQAFLSHHLGDLDHYEAYRAFEKDVTLYKDLFDIVPELIVHDLHPDYATTHYALRRGVPTFAVQHHHAHLASCMTDNGLNEPVIGVTFDGTGYGPDNTIWGGEFLVGDYRTYRRAASFRCVGLPGGDRAVREPWRIALSYLRDAGESDVFLDRILEASRRTVRTMLDRGINSPLTSSAGRLFDVVAVLAGVRDTVNYEGQAAIELERLATGIAEEGHYPFAIEQPTVPEGPQVVDTRPLILAVVTDVKNGVDAAVIGRRFHTTLVEIIVAVCRRLHEETGIDAVLLSGGVFLNILLTAETEERLTQDGFRAYRHSLVPPGDGGLCLGQLAIAAAVLGQ